MPANSSSATEVLKSESGCESPADIMPHVGVDSLPSSEPKHGNDGVCEKQPNNEQDEQFLVVYLQGIRFAMVALL